MNRQASALYSQVPLAVFSVRIKIAKSAGYDQIITFDMGGTSTDASLCNNGISLTTESTISGLPIKVPLIDIHTVGAGGGSIATIDAGGALRVGPESAGADPGPICYGNNGENITVTDANLFLGRIAATQFLDGAMPLDTDKTHIHIEKFASRLGISPFASRGRYSQGRQCRDGTRNQSHLCGTRV